MILITARKRSLGQGNVFRSICYSVHWGGGPLYDVTSCLAASSHVPSRGVSVPGSMFLSMSGESLSRWSLSRGVYVGRPLSPPRNQKSGQYTSYWNVFLFRLCFNKLTKIIFFAAIGRTLIPRYFRTIFEGGVTDLYYILKHPKESFHQTTITLDCDQALMVTHHGKPMFTKVCLFY